VITRSPKVGFSDVTKKCPFLVTSLLLLLLLLHHQQLGREILRMR